jgi:4-amino-4-deoxy-L-arabinose transferase-like glycosyltransferase
VTTSMSPPAVADVSARGWSSPESLGRAALWLTIVWIVVFWKLGFPSFWDPDEATYALVSREMARGGHWLIPTIEGVPFFDKPVLFYLLQAASFAAFGESEWAARLVPALSTIPVFLVTAWAGRTLFSREAGRLAPLALAVLPATFALSDYAILDMLFTAWLFSAVVVLVVSVVRSRPGLQWVAFLLLVPAVLTKGPLALVLPALAFVLALLHRRLRPRLLALHWFVGPIAVVALSLPWFLWMWGRFGDAFINGYLLRENILLYARPLYGRSAGSLNYLSVIAVGLLPWTPVIVGRLMDRLRGQRFSDAEFLLLAWVLALVGFFGLSRFKLDHYVYPVAPALCLLAAESWDRARRLPADHTFTLVGVSLVGVVQFGGGCYMLFGLIPGLSVAVSGWIYLIPTAMILAGVVATWDLQRRNWVPRLGPMPQVLALLVVFAVIQTVGYAAIERAKPIKAMALATRTMAAPGDLVAGYRMNRWMPSWRFYVDRPTKRIETREELLAFFATPGTHYCVMFGHEWRVAQLAGLKARVVLDRRGLMMTTGRGLRGGQASQARFVVVTDAPVPR